MIGKATYYAPGAMKATARWRELDLEGYAGGVSLMSPADIGHKVWLKRPGHDWEGPFLVVDCARRGDMYGVIVSRGEVIEVDFQTAQRWGLVKWGGSSQPGGYVSWWKAKEWLVRDVQVSKIDPSLLSDEPEIYRDWFLEQIEYAARRGPRVRFRPPNEWRINGEWHRFNGYHEDPDPPDRLPAVEHSISRGKTDRAPIHHWPIMKYGPEPIILG